MTTRPDTPTFRREQDLAAPVARYLRNRAFRQQILEVPFYEYRMDMYGYSRHADLTVAVELKLARWSRAIKQALLYQLCSDLVYIALPRSKVRWVDVSILEEHGLGLIAVEKGRCREVVRPIPSAVVRKHYRDRYLSILQEGIEDGL